MTYEESIQMDNERVRFIDQIMYDLGFRKHLPHESRRGPHKFTDSILYHDDESGDRVKVSFPHEDQVERGLKITTQARFNNKTKSPEWQSLYQFEEEIGSWIQECRGKDGPHG